MVSFHLEPFYLLFYWFFQGKMLLVYHHHHAFPMVGLLVGDFSVLLRLDTVGLRGQNNQNTYNHIVQTTQMYLGLVRFANNLHPLRHLRMYFFRFQKDTFRHYKD